MTTATLHSCARCGRKDTAEHMIYSRHTHARYCWNLDACASRVRANQRAAGRALSQPAPAYFQTHP